MNLFENDIFQYEENFTEKQIERIRDNERILIKNDTPLIILITRLLMGNVKIHADNSTIVSRVDYYSHYPVINDGDFSKHKRKRLQELAITLSSDEIKNKIEDLSRKNKPMFINICSEISCYFIYKHKKSYTIAFLHLYRCYEYISYALPLIYIKSFDNYHKSYKDLQKWFGNDKNLGELGFFKKFINDKLFEDDQAEYLNLCIEFPEEVFNKVEQDMRQILNEKIIIENNSIIVPPKNVHEFFVSLRNRHFHYLTGSNQLNFHSNKILFDEFFLYINEHILGWIAYVFKFVIDESII